MSDDNRSVAVRAILGTAALASLPHEKVDYGHMERCIAALSTIGVSSEDMTDALHWVMSKMPKLMDTVEVKE